MKRLKVLSVASAAFLFIAITGGTRLVAEEQEASPRTLPAKQASIDFSTPGDAWCAYLIAVKENDLAAAKDCWWVSDEDKSDVWDVIAGMWVAYHRFNGAMRTLGIDERQLGDNLIRADCTDVAIDRTLDRLDKSRSAITGNTAELRIVWDENDGYPNDVFGYGDDPILFRKVNGSWKIDTYAMCGIEKPSEFLEAGGWGLGFRKQTNWLNDISSSVENGKLKTTEAVVAELERHLGSLKGRIPFTRKVIFERDTAKQYLRITMGNPGIVLTTGEQLPHRPEIKYPRKVEGDLQFVFETIYGWDRPKIVVETSNADGYEVVYDPDDEHALTVVAEKLGMTVKEETREILALSLAVAPDGHQLKRCPKPDTPQWNSFVRDDNWPLHGVTMDELVKFLESRYRRPVVNKTRLSGYYSLDLSSETVKLWPRREEIKQLDDTGLQIKWERSKTKVLVIKDK